MYEVIFDSSKLTDVFLEFIEQYAKKLEPTSGRFWRAVSSWARHELDRRAEQAACKLSGKGFDATPCNLVVPKMDVKWLKFALVQLYSMLTSIGNTWLSPDSKGQHVHPSAVLPTVEFVEAIRFAIWKEWCFQAGPAPTTGKPN